MSMACSLSNKCAKNLCKRRVLVPIQLIIENVVICFLRHSVVSIESQYSTVVLTVVRVMIAKYRKSGIWGYRSSLTPEPVELK